MVSVPGFSLTCLCQSGIDIMVVLGLVMAVSLFKLNKMADDKDFRIIFIGSLFFAASHLISAVHAAYSNFFPAIWAPDLQAYMIAFEMFSYIMMFWGMQNHFQRYIGVSEE